MRFTAKVQPWVVFGLGTQLLGCPLGPAPINKDGQTSSTLTPSGNILQTRLWSVSRDGQLQSLLSPATVPVSVEWSTVGTFDGIPASNAGVSAVSFAASTDRHERVFYVDTAGGMRAHAVKNGASSWFAINNPPMRRLAGPVSAILLGTNAQRVAAVTAETPAKVLIFGNSQPTDEMFSVVQDCAGTPEDIWRGSIVVGTARGSEFCFAAQGVNGALSLCPSGDQSTPPGTTWEGGATATAWTNGTVNQFEVFVRGADGTIRRATWTGACAGQPIWSKLDALPSGVSPGRYAMSAAARSPQTGGQGIELVVAGNDGKLYQKKFVTNTWGPWTEIAAPADTIGRLGGVHVPAQDATKTFFVGDVSISSLQTPAAGCVFEVSNGATLNHTDPVVGLVAASDGAAFPGAWTESSLAERNGKVIVGASVIGAEPDPARVAISYSPDDGHNWRSMLIPHQYAQTPDRFLIQGDPFAAMDSKGTGYVVMHELTIDTNCVTIDFFHSKIYVAKTTSGTSAIVEPSDIHWQRSADPTLGVKTFLDHPTMAITSDDTQHYAWLLNCPAHADPQCPTGSDTVYYRKRSPNSSTFDTPIPVSAKPGPFGIPYIFADVADHVYIAWVHNDPSGMVPLPHLYMCQWNGNGCSQGVVNVTQPQGACAMAIADVGFVDTMGQPRDVRAGAMAVAASGATPNHIFAAFQIKENTLGTPNCTASMGPRDIAFMESTNGGGIWSTPIIISTQADEVGTDQFMPSIASHDDGTVLVTYYDRSVGASGSRVQQRVAIRHPDGTWAHKVRRSDSGILADLALLPRKCGDTSQELFMGDYHVAVGGKTHAHALRVDALSLPSGPTIRLQASALSGSAWR